MKELYAYLEDMQVEKSCWNKVQHILAPWKIVGSEGKKMKHNGRVFSD
jgi:hypothetical protein